MKEQSAENNNPDIKEDVVASGLSKIWNALFIGILFGIVIYSVVVNSWGIFTLIPLYFIYRLIKQGTQS